MSSFDSPSIRVGGDILRFGKPAFLFGEPEVAFATGGGVPAPLKLNDKLGLLGDSYAAAATATSTNFVQLNDAGNSMAFGNAFGGGALTFQVGANQGVGGNQVSQYLARLSAMNATGARVVIMGSDGINDLMAGISTSTTLANIDLAITGLTADYIVLCTVPKAPVLTAGQETNRGTLNAGIRARASVRVKIADFDTAITDSSFFQADNIHPNGKGALAAGHVIGTALAAIQDPSADLAALIASTALGTGANPTMSGNSSGLATGWSKSASQVTLTATKDASGDQILTTSGTYTGASGNATATINQFPGVTLVAGDIIELICIFKILTDFANLKSISIYNQLFSSDFGTIYAGQLGWATTASGCPYTVSDGWLYMRSPQLAVGAGAGGAFLQNNFTLNFKDGSGLNAAGAVQIKRFGTRKVT